MPSRRKSSIERAATWLHLTLGGSPAWRSSRTVARTPRPARSSARVRPTGPPPTTATSVSMIVVISVLSVEVPRWTASRQAARRQCHRARPDTQLVGLRSNVGIEPEDVVLAVDRPRIGGSSPTPTIVEPLQLHVAQEYL